MVRFVAVGLRFTAGLTLLAGGFSATYSANPPVTLDTAPAGIVPDIGLGPGDVPQRAIGRGGALSGNPLWAVPLSSLSATRERPLFRPSRRPLTPAIPGQPRVETANPDATSESERPQLTLVGAVTGEAEGIAIFIGSNNEVIRLRTGQDYLGWVLNGVRGREATLQKDNETAVFALAAPDGTSSPTGQVGADDPSAASSANQLMPSVPGEFAPYVSPNGPQDTSTNGL